MPFRCARWLAVLVVLAACGDAGDAISTTSEPATPPSFPVIGEQIEIPPLPELDPGSVVLGQLLYGRHCASCHGLTLAGDSDWQTPNNDGSYPPPPQDSSGHTWHHSDQLLVNIILNGSDFPQSQMEAFGGVITEDEVLAILAYLKSSWGPLERDVQWGATVRDAARQEG